MTVRVGINGFGRIGRNYLRCALERAENPAGTSIEVVAVNDLTSPEALAHLLAYDSTYGRLGRVVEHDDSSLTVDGHRVAVTAERDPGALAWGDLGVDVVIESTGRFRTREQAGLHLRAGARKVLLSRRPGEGLRLVRQRVGVHQPAARPHGVRRREVAADLTRPGVLSLLAGLIACPPRAPTATVADERTAVGSTRIVGGSRCQAPRRLGRPR